MTNKEKTIKELKEVLDSLDITNEYRLNLIKAIEYLQEEPVSDDLEKEIEESWKHLDLSFIGSGYEMFKVRNIVSDIAHHFAYWKKQQMMKDAVEVRIKTSMVGRVIGLWDVYGSYSKEYKELKDGDVLKVIIIKED